MRHDINARAALALALALAAASAPAPHVVPPTPAACPCSAACTCGCNEGRACECNAPRAVQPITTPRGVIYYPAVSRTLIPYAPAAPTYRPALMRSAAPANC